MAWEWLAPSAVAVGAAASFTGARLGARANREASAEATAQRERQARREEWGRRFTAALDRATSDDDRDQELGVILLAALLQSSLASDDDRDLALTVWRSFVEAPEDLMSRGVDESVVIVDDEDSEPGGDRG